ncbi:hypothetical protein SEA_PHEROBRINE_74 [Gordonia phage Pherobrine]|nr:hypothetical protein SEA_PHEROBRINE_74 [Gordonia phage Pherobrine]
MGYTTETPDKSSPKPAAPVNKTIPVEGLETQMFQRKPFEVEAVQITEENFEKVAAWCSGSIVTVQEKSSFVDREGPVKRHIQVPVARPLNKRQSEAYVGDWLLFASKGFKVYANRPFLKNFETVPEELFVTNEPAGDS